MWWKQFLRILNIASRVLLLLLTQVILVLDAIGNILVFSVGWVASAFIVASLASVTRLLKLQIRWTLAVCEISTLVELSTANSIIIVDLQLTTALLICSHQLMSRQRLFKTKFTVGIIAFLWILSFLNKILNHLKMRWFQWRFRFTLLRTVLLRCESNILWLPQRRLSC